MKQFFRILLAVGVLAFAASMLAVSCGKTPAADGGTVNNNSGGGSGGNGGGGGNNQPQAGPPAIALTNFETNAAKLVVGTSGTLDTIRIKGSEIPTTTVAAGGHGASLETIRLNSTSSGANFKRIFDITITGGTPGAATGGLIMVGGANITSVDGFSDSSTGTTAWSTANEGYFSGTMGSNNVQPRTGWGHFGTFLSGNIPTSSDPNTSPFAFTEVENAALGRRFQPLMYCVAVLTNIDDGGAGVSPTDTFAGGQTASCYVGIATTVGMNINTWLGTAASATFKKTFNMAIGGLRTDGKTVSQFMPGADDTARTAALRNGLSGAEIAEIIKTNPSAYKKIAVTIVSDTNF